MKLKKVLKAVLSVSLVACLSIAGTIAYLQDTDDDVNVMTLGNVAIDQLEYERVIDENGAWITTGETDKYGYTPDKIQEYTQDKPLYPAVFVDGEIKWDDRNNGTYQQSWGQIGAFGSNQLFDDSVKNVQDKFVFVKNTGKTNAYVRTFIAFEAGNMTIDDIKNDKKLHHNADKTHWEWEWFDNYVEVDGVNYVVAIVTYLGPSSNPNGVLAPGAVSYPSLLQVFLDPSATNEDVEAFGDTYEIIVVTQAIQTDGFANAKTALNEGFGQPSINLLSECFGDAIDEFNAPEVDTWDGTSDTTWYNDSDTEFTITTAEQLAGLAELVDGGNSFESKAIKLGKDIDLYAEDTNGNAICFDPIGSYRNDTAFKGTFDGQEHTISNMSQNTWALNNGYYYGDLGLGLFGYIEDATIKNLTMDKASISGESAICGTVAAAAYGDCTFENIKVTNSQVNDYQYYAGGIVGWASGTHTYTDINVDSSTIVGSQWGDFGNANGGIIGGIGSSAVIKFKDCIVACRIDATNDVVSAYQWYNYRNSGMLVGRVPQTITNGEVQTVATPTNVTCENVTVVYGDWANYTYCEFAGTGYPYVRVQAGVSVDGYSNVRYGHPTDANGNTVVDDNHVHNDGEDHKVLIAFDQLFGGPAEHRYCYYGISEYDGVTVVYNNK